MTTSLYQSVPTIRFAQAALSSANGKVRTFTLFRLAYSSAQCVLGSSMLLAIRLFNIHCLVFRRVADLAYAISIMIIFAQVQIVRTSQLSSR